VNNDGVITFNIIIDYDILIIINTYNKHMKKIQYTTTLFAAAFLALSVGLFVPNATFASNGEDEMEVEVEVEIHGDGIDNDRDGKTDEVNTGAHKSHETEDVEDEDRFDEVVSTFEGKAKGKVKVKFKDGSVFEHRIFHNATAEKDTTLEQLKGSGLLLAVRGNGKTIAAVNPYTGKKVDTAKLSLARTFGKHTVKQTDFLENGSEEVLVVSSNQKNVVHLTLLRFNTTDDAFDVLSRKTVFSVNAVPKKTTLTTNTIQLKNAKGRTVKTLTVDDYYKMQ
jgi:hypothetical protein